MPIVSRAGRSPPYWALPPAGDCNIADTSQILLGSFQSCMQVPDGPYDTSSILATPAPPASRWGRLQPCQQLGDRLTAGVGTPLGILGGIQVSGRRRWGLRRGHVRCVGPLVGGPHGAAGVPPSRLVLGRPPPAHIFIVGTASVG